MDQKETISPVKFDRLNKLDKLEFLVSRNPQKLLGLLKKLQRETDILSIYHASGFHYCWFYTNDKINKVKDE